MTTEPNARDRMRSILVLVATIATIAFNGLAAAGYVNGITPEVISNKYPTLLTPAGWAFSIWALIYIGMIAFSGYQMMADNLARFRTVRSLYIASCLFNCAWIYFWHRDQVAICFFLIFGLLLSLVGLLILLRRPGSDIGPLFTKTPIGLYAGWVTAATLVNFAVMLKSFGAGLSPAAWNVLGVTFLALAAGLAVVMRLQLKNYMYALAIAWAATGIAVKQSGNTAIVVASSICVIICLVMAVSFVLDQKSTTT